MAYQALYRTYRPQKFNEVVGQEVVVKTLQNAIEQDKISHAYLFSGPRGTGKTTVARIFAKALNCPSRVDKEPCGECQSCKEITEGISMDVVEVDAASNSGVDEIRQIRDKAKFLPSGVKYKVYIIDEVHMLTTQSFNALLKTLEEPPTHVVFILATTEPQRIPLTILSRCQRFEFKALTNTEIEEQLRNVCQKENVNITEEALIQIAEGSEGALRDALSCLDQAISFANGEIGVNVVNMVLGSLSTDRLISLGKLISEQNVTEVLNNIHQLIDSGKEADKIIAGLLGFYHDMLLYKNVTDGSYLKYIFEKETFKELAEKISDDLIYFYVEVLSDAQNKIKYASSPVLYLEIAFIKLTNSCDMSLNYLNRINDLEQKVYSIDLSGVEQQAASLNPDDVEKINLTEEKVNRVISELSKLELNKLGERVLTLEAKVANPVAQSSLSSDSDIAELKEEIAFLKANVSTIKQQTSDPKPEFDTTEIDEKLSKLEQKVNSLPRVDVDQINQDSLLLDELKERLDNLENSKKDTIFDFAEAKTTEAPQEEVIEEVKEEPVVEQKPFVEQGSLDIFGTFNEAKDEESNEEVNVEELFEEEDEVKEEAIEEAPKETAEESEPIETVSSIYDDKSTFIDSSNEQEANDLVMDLLNGHREEPKPVVQEVVNNTNDYCEDEVLQDVDEKIEELMSNLGACTYNYKCTFNNFDVYEPDFEEGYDVGDPVYVLVEGNNVRFSNDTESKSIYAFIYGGEPQEKDGVAEENTNHDLGFKPSTTIEEDTTHIQDIINNQLDTTDFGTPLPSDEEKEVVEENEPILSANEQIVTENEPILTTTEDDTEEVAVDTNTSITEEVEDNVDEFEEKDVEEVKSEELVTEKEVKKPSLFDFNSENVNAENPYVAPAPEKKEEAVEQYQESYENKVEEKPIDKYNSYDIRFVVEILWNATSEVSRNDKERLIRTWQSLSNDRRPDTQAISSRLAQGSVKACGNKEFIIVYKNATLCNQVMAPSFKSKAIEILRPYLDGAEFNYIALPEYLWNEIRNEYVTQWKANNGVCPKLKPITDPELQVIPLSQEYKDPTDEVADGLKNLFGDKLKIR